MKKLLVRAALVCAAATFVVAAPSATFVGTGAHKWLVVLCNFSDEQVQPNSQAYYQALFANAGRQCIIRQCTNDKGAIGALAVPIGPLLSGGMPMHYRGFVSALALAGSLMLTATLATAFDESKFPNMKGQWMRVGPPNWQPVSSTAPGLRPILDANFAVTVASNVLT